MLKTNLSDIFSDLNTESSVILPKSIKIKNIKGLDTISDATSSFMPQKGSYSDATSSFMPQKGGYSDATSSFMPQKGGYLNGTKNKDINQLISMLSDTSYDNYTANSTDTEQLKNKLFNIIQGGSPPEIKIEEQNSDTIDLTDENENEYVIVHTEDSRYELKLTFSPNNSSVIITYPGNRQFQVFDSNENEMISWIDKVILDPLEEDIYAITLLWNALKILNNNLNKDLEKTKKCKLNLNQVIKWLYLFFTLVQSVKQIAITMNDKTIESIWINLNNLINKFNQNKGFDESDISMMTNSINSIKDSNTQWLQMFFDVCIQFHTKLITKRKKAFKKQLKDTFWNAYDIDTYNASTDLPPDFEKVINDQQVTDSIKYVKNLKDRIALIMATHYKDNTHYNITYDDKDIFVETPTFVF